MLVFHYVYEENNGSQGKCSPCPKGHGGWLIFGIQDQGFEVLGWFQRYGGAIYGREKESSPWDQGCEEDKVRLNILNVCWDPGHKKNLNQKSVWSNHQCVFVIIARVSTLLVPRRMVEFSC